MQKLWWVWAVVSAATRCSPLVEDNCCRIHAKRARIIPKKRKEKIKFETWWNIIPLAASASVWALCLCALYGYCILSVCVEEFSRQICPFWSTISRKALAPNMFALSWNPYSYLNGKLHVFWVSIRRRTRNATQTFSERRECFSYVIPVLTKRSIVQSFFYVCVFFMAKWRNPDTLEQFK